MPSPSDTLALVSAGTAWGAVLLWFLKNLGALDQFEFLWSYYYEYRKKIKPKLGSVVHLLLGRVWSKCHIAPSLVQIASPGKLQVKVVRTAKSTGERLTNLQTLRMVPRVMAKENEATITLDPNTRYQTCLGFGGAFTESSADIMQKLSAKNQAEIINAYFSEETGLGYRIGRVHMNSCDFSTGHWACANHPHDECLDRFSIERYRKTMLPMMRQAVAAAGQPLTLFFSPWSPPAWMKSSGSMNGGKLLKRWAKVWADYYVRFAQEFAKEGMPFWGLTVQNEPNAGCPWETCSYSAEEERDFVRDHLGPAVEASGLDLKVIVWDHNRDDMFTRTNTIVSDPKAAKYVWGVGYHWYGDPRYETWPDKNGMVAFDNLQRVHEIAPDKHIMMTECCQETGPRVGDWKLGERYAESIIKDFNHWCEAWVDWNLVLDLWGGPNHQNNACSAPIIANTYRDSLLYLSSFYYIGHFSRYIQRGAQRIAIGTSRDHLESTAFINPDGTIAVVVMNQSSANCDFWLQCSGAAVKASAPARSITTFIVGPTQ